jgi:hypothetical protein
LDKLPVFTYEMRILTHEDVWALLSAIYVEDGNIEECS